MKTYLLGFIFLGFTSFMCAQNELASLTISNKTINPKVKTIKDADYLNTMTSLDISKRILKLQDIVAKYNIKTNKIYRTNSNTTYTVNFTEGENHLKAIYDKEGKLLSCQENYQGIKLPYTISSEVVKNNPGWALTQVYCDIDYTKNVETQIVYRVVIKKGRKTKTVLING